MAGDVLLAGIDFGTTNLKAILFTPAGEIVAAASAPTPTHYPRPGWAYFDPDEVWEVVTALLRSVVAQVPNPQAIHSIAATSVGESAVPLDDEDRPTYPAIAWFDNRTEPQARWLAEHVGRDRLFAASGLSLQPIYSLNKLLWLRDHEPAAFARTHLWLYMADFIAYRLCGVAASEYSLASRTLILDVQHLTWNFPLLDEVGIPSAWMAPLLPSGTALGTVLPEVATTTGLPLSTVVATGGHDHVCAALALGITDPDTVLNSLGTAQALLLPAAAPQTNPQVGIQGYSQGAHVAGGYYLLGGLYTSGACIEWFRHAFAPDTELGVLEAEARQAPQGSLGVTFHPLLRLANAPHSDPLARGAFIGLNTDARRGVLFRAVLEGIAYEARSALEPLLGYAGLTRPRRIVATGGSTRSNLLMQIKADIYGQPLDVVSVDESTALGAALLGGMGAGFFSDSTHACAGVRYTQTTFQPDQAAAGFYDRCFRDVYQELYPTLRTLNHRTYAIQHDPSHGI